ncbi:hypothetical protein FBF26_04235 [Candidatus Saccharibacteria bacterium oral taxon 488]|jgi:hypothetical protein|nr:hypothetical protein FBF26_04235 [Candidatus Saccharibacteria bacterium oral taxon 488]
MEDSELPEQKYAMAFGAIPDKAEERTVMRNIEDMLYEENKLYASLFQAATRLLDQNPGMHYNDLTAELKREFPEASMYPIRFAADDAQESLRR